MIIRRLLGLAVVVAASIALLSQTRILGSVGHKLGRLSVWWVIVALAAELVSYLASAELQHRLLNAVGAPVGRLFLVALNYASSALAALLPAGTVVATGYTYRRLRCRGARPTAVAWVLVASAVASGAALALIALAGAGIRGIGLFCSVLGWFVAALTSMGAIGALTLLAWASRDQSRLSRITAAGTRAADRARRATHRRPTMPRAPLSWGGDPVAMGPVGWMTVWTAAAANWLADGAVLGLSFVALGFVVPWQGLAFAYAIGQIATSLPVGCIGLVEGSLTLALACVGVPADRAVAVVLVYRLVSFWSILPVGWLAGRWLRHRDNPLSAGRTGNQIRLA